MDQFLAWSRCAFRAVHGLPCAEPSRPVAAEERASLLAWARMNRMAGLLQAGLPDLDPALRSAAYGQAQHSARGALEAERIFALLSSSLSTLALIKGPALAAQAWPDPGLRSFDDLDFLTDRSDEPCVLEGLQAAGYRPEVDDPNRRAHLWHYGWGVSFRHSEGFLVEVNHRIFPPHYPWPRALSAARRDLFQMQTLDGAAVSAPAPPLHLIHACLHAVWHGWSRLAWLADIAGLLARHPDCFAQAQALAPLGSFAEKALVAGCAVAEALFGPGVSAAGAPAPLVEAARAVLAGDAPPLVAGKLRRFHEHFMSPGEVRSYRLRRFWIPGDGDFQWISLPAAARGLYWLLRPLRGALYAPAEG